MLDGEYQSHTHHRIGYLNYFVVVFNYIDCVLRTSSDNLAIVYAETIRKYIQSVWYACWLLRLHFASFASFASFRSFAP